MTTRTNISHPPLMLIHRSLHEQTKNQRTRKKLHLTPKGGDTRDAIKGLPDAEHSSLWTILQKAHSREDSSICDYRSTGGDSVAFFTLRRNPDGQREEGRPLDRVAAATGQVSEDDKKSSGPASAARTPPPLLPATSPLPACSSHRHPVRPRERGPASLLCSFPS